MLSCVAGWSLDWGVSASQAAYEHWDSLQPTPNISEQEEVFVKVWKNDVKWMKQLSKLLLLFFFSVYFFYLRSYFDSN